MLNMVDILGVDLWQPISGGKKGGGGGGGGEGEIVLQELLTNYTSMLPLPCANM